MTRGSNLSDEPAHAVTAPKSGLGDRLARRVFANYVFHSLNWGIRLVEQLLLIPLFINAWGTDLYSDWLVITSIVFFLGWCSFGIDDYFGNNLLRLASVADYAGFNRELRTGLFVSCALAVLLSALLLCSLGLVPVTSALTLSSMDAHTAALVIAIMTPVWIGYPIAILHGVYRAYGEFSRGERVSGVYMAAQLASVVVALLLHLSPLVIASCYCVGSLLRAVFIAFDVSRRYPAVTLRMTVLERREWRRMVKQSLLYFTNPLSVALTQNGALLVFGSFGIAAKTIVAFNIYRVLTGLTRQFGIASFALGSGIEMARQYAQGEHEACRRLHASSGRIVACLGGILAGLTVPVSAPFVRLWTHGAVAEDQALVVCFLAGIFFGAPGRVSLMLLRYTNHAYAVAFASCSYSVGGLALALALAHPLGGFGVALGLAIGEVAGIGLYPPIAAGTLLRFGWFRYILGCYTAGGAAFALSYLVARLLFPSSEIGFAELAVRLVAWAAVAAPFLVLFALSAPQRKRAFAWVHGAFTIFVRTVVGKVA